MEFASASMEGFWQPPKSWQRREAFPPKTKVSPPFENCIYVMILPTRPCSKLPSLSWRCGLPNISDLSLVSSISASCQRLTYPSHHFLYLQGKYLKRQRMSVVPSSLLEISCVWFLDYISGNESQRSYVTLLLCINTLANHRYHRFWSYRGKRQTTCIVLVGAIGGSLLNARTSEEIFVFAEFCYLIQ